MLKDIVSVLCALLFVCCLVGCEQTNQQPETTETILTTAQTESVTSPTTQVQTIATTAPTVEIPVPTAETTIATEPTATLEHSPLYIPGVEVEDVIRYFNEVCLDAEFVNSGDASLLQKWDAPIRYTIHGTPSEEDRIVLINFVNWLNTVEGFPGMEETQDTSLTNLRIYFCSQEALINHLGDNFVGMDGGVTS